MGSNLYGPERGSHLQIRAERVRSQHTTHKWRLPGNWGQVPFLNGLSGSDFAGETFRVLKEKEKSEKEEN